VTFQQAVSVTDTQGGRTTTYTDRSPKSWALVEPLTNREALQVRQLTAVLTDALSLPYRADLKNTDRVKVDARTLQVQSIQDPDGRKRELRILAIEVEA
jgi:SPP1 family predicted phage head-tail adaptor